MPLRTNGTGFQTKLPDYFFSLSDSRRWYDKFAANELTGEERLVLDVNELSEKYARDKAYAAWLKAFGIRPKRMKWQAIRVIRDMHKEASPKDWWPKYYGAMFRVWLQPETFKEGREWVQYYILHPEDCELIQRHELREKGISVPERSALEPFVSEDPRLRICRVIPTQCAWQLRNETSGGKLDHLSVL